VSPKVYKCILADVKESTWVSNIAGILADAISVAFAKICKIMTIKFINYLVYFVGFIFCSIISQHFIVFKWTEQKKLILFTQKGF
jgi:hypothetical protein